MNASNRTLDDELSECAEACTRYAAARGQVFKAKYALMSQIYSAYAFVKTHGLQEDVAARLRAKGHECHSPTLFLRPLISSFLKRKDRDLASRWGRVMELAEYQGINPEELTKFIRKSGGIENCLRIYRDTMWKKQSSNSTGAPTPTMRQSKFGGMPVRFDEKVRGRLLSISQRRNSYRVKIFGKLRNGVLRVTTVRAYTLRRPPST